MAISLLQYLLFDFPLFWFLFLFLFFSYVSQIHSSVRFGSVRSDEGTSKTFTCARPLVGQFVAIQLVGVEGSLSLCEVEVFSNDGKCLFGQHKLSAIAALAHSEDKSQFCWALRFSFELNNIIRKMKKITRIKKLNPKSIQLHLFFHVCD